MIETLNFAIRDLYSDPKPQLLDLVVTFVVCLTGFAVIKLSKNGIQPWHREVYHTLLNADLIGPIFQSIGVIILAYSTTAFVRQSPKLHRQAVYMIDTFHLARYIIVIMCAAGLPYSKALTIGTGAGFITAAFEGTGFNIRGIEPALQYLVVAWFLFGWNEWNGRGLLLASEDRSDAPSKPLLYVPRMALARCGFTSLQQASSMVSHRTEAKTE